jgi:L-ascorbate metabolism protein UlaG (beta-lactamase superfamily)
MDAGETLTLKGVVVEAKPADHPARPLPGRPHTDCLGFVIHSRHRVYFSGDTDLFPGMADFGPIDVALLPVWGWGPTLGAGHMDPWRAAQSLELLRPSLAIPIHWGTYFPLGLRPLLPDYVRQPPYTFARHANRLAPDVQVCVLDPGDALDLTVFYRHMGV